jgi:hypothetical protein
MGKNNKQYKMSSHWNIGKSTSAKEGTKYRTKLHKIIYNNKDKIHHIDDETLMQLKYMIESKDPNDRVLAKQIIFTSKLTPKQAVYVVGNYYKIMDPLYAHSDDNNAISGSI